MKRLSIKMSWQCFTVAKSHLYSAYNIHYIYKYIMCVIVHMYVRMYIRRYGGHIFNPSTQ